VFQCPHRPFHSLVRSILYQQLAFKAAASVYSRFLALLGGEASVAPDAVLALSPHQLRQIGVSPRKASYLHDLARKYASGILSDASIVNMDDRSLAAMLTMVKGIGAWSVHMFMIFSLARPDVLPSADLGVRKGVQMLYALQDVPRPSQMDRLCERWRPYRSVGAWYMWRLIESKVPQPAPPIPALPSPDGQIMLQQQQQQSVIQMIIPF
jgi:DNA-3-methyladenine glycosylase II